MPRVHAALGWCKSEWIKWRPSCTSSHTDLSPPYLTKLLWSTKHVYSYQIALVRNGRKTEEQELGFSVIYLDLAQNFLSSLLGFHSANSWWFSLFSSLTCQMTGCQFCLGYPLKITLHLCFPCCIDCLWPSIWHKGKYLLQDALLTQARILSVMRAGLKTDLVRKSRNPLLIHRNACTKILSTEEGN